MNERTSEDSEHGITERYRYAEYERAGSSVSVVQDTENEQAWIQSTHAVAVEP